MTGAEAPPAASPPPPGTIACPRCTAPVGPDQDWCLACGAAARTRMVRAPSWKVPVALLATVVVASVIALALAFVALTGDGSPATGASGATGATGATTVLPAPAPVAPAPVAPTGPTGTTGTTAATG